MKKFNLIFLIVLFTLLFSCAGKPKVKSTDNNEQVKENVVEKTEKPAEKIDGSAVDEKAPVDLTVAAAKEPANTPTDVSAEKPAEISVEKSAEEPLNEKVTQADSGKELIADTASLSGKNETSAAREPAAKTPSVSPAPSSQAQTQPSQTQPSQSNPPAQRQQAQPPQTNPPAQRQQAQQPQSNPPAQGQQTTQSPAQPPTEEKKDSSDTASSGDDSQDEKKPSSYMADGNYAPAARIESLTQMGTMPQDKEIIFSRIVRATVGQIVEIPFRGNGWVYLGELTSQRGIVYSSRRNDSDGQNFIFTLEEAGTYALKFYRQDFIRDFIINDHVQIVAGEAPSAGAGWFNPPADRGRVVAQPRWPSQVEETQIRSGIRPASEPVVTSADAESAKETASASSTAPQQKTVSAQETRAPQRTTPARETNPADRTPSQNTPASSAAGGQTAVTQNTQAGQPASATAAEQRGGESPSMEKPEKLAPEALLKKAKETFDGGNIAAAIALLEQFVTDYPGGSDEVYWQLGQCYEANSPSRNILSSLDYYRRLTNEYPQSGRFNDARRRIAYLERYYINIQ